MTLTMKQKWLRKRHKMTRNDTDNDAKMTHRGQEHHRRYGGHHHLLRAAVELDEKLPSHCKRTELGTSLNCIAVYNTPLKGALHIAVNIYAIVL